MRLRNAAVPSMVALVTGLGFTPPAVTAAGSETDYSGMIMDHGGYYKMINSLLDDLADLADAIPMRP